MPGFGGQQPQQQQQQQQGRSVSNRLPNGKLGKDASIDEIMGRDRFAACINALFLSAGSNGSGWAFGNGMPMGGATLQNPSRQLGGNVSFAQSLGGSSQPSTPLDPSEFPSLSNNAQLGNANQSSMWATAGSRAVSGQVPRNTSTPLSSQGPQEDLYNSTSSSRGNGGFRFGAQGTVGQPSQNSATPADDFPPLNRNANGEIGGERGAGLMSSLGFGAQAPSAAPSIPGSRAAGNGLLNALSANNRSSDAQSPPQANATTAGSADEERKASLGVGMSAPTESPSQDASNSHSLAGLDAAAHNGKARETEDGEASDAQDPLAGMAPIDKFGIKGLRTMMNNNPSYAALMHGMDPNDLGLNVNSPDLISTQQYSLFDDTPPRPVVPSHRLPECYQVTNVQPIETKIQSFNEETLFWIFYSCPQDVKQQLAAFELHSRNWRWHKKLHIWLTKDETMTPQTISPTHEQGYYVIWDIRNWRKERVRLQPI
ncbi:NOT2/NOT3/NOT5 family protein [Verticillium dahliae]